MAIPDFQSIFLPLLKACADGKEHTKQELLPLLAKQFGLTEAELSVRIASGGAGMFDNRVGWATSYLKQARLLENLRRGVYRITDRGLRVLDESPQPLNVRYLKRATEFLASRGKPTDESKFVESASVNSETPDELLAGGYKQLRDTLAAELLDRIKTISPARFEKLVVDLLLKMGYGGTQEDAGQVMGKSGDGGIDGIIKEDRLGLDVIYIQAKRWESYVVGRPEIQKFVGALAAHKATKGVFITSSTYSKEAQEYISQITNKIVLIDGAMLAELMMDFDLGVSTKEVYTVKRLDTDYFEED
ncbi:MAG: restriction endonuclease [Candidatus Nitrotoga sp.]